MPATLELRNVVRARHGLTLLIVALTAWPAAAQQPTAAQTNAIRQACRSDYMSHCAAVPTGGTAALACLQQNAAKTSPGCQQALRAVERGANTATAPAASTSPAAARATRAPAAMPAVTAAGTDTWPHTVTGEAGTATVYQPQVVAWPDRQMLQTRVAMAVTPTGAKAAAHGTVDVAFTTSTDLASRTVTLTNPKLVKTQFPTLDTGQAVNVEDRIKAALDNLGEKRVPLDTLLISLRQEADKPPEVALKNEPPAIFTSQRAASLLVFDGEPIMTPVAGTPLAYAVNTNWDVFKDNDTGTWYWLNNGAWLTARDAKGPWSPAGPLPPAFSGLPSDANFAAVKKQIPGRTITARDLPAIFVSFVPAEIIVTSGPPAFTAIPGTSLSYVANTDAALFRETRGTFYYLVSGRWFSAPSLDGPWTFATASLPPDFMRIPANGPRGFVLASVPGTPQAQEALIQAQIPQQATLEIATAKVDVVYAGAPKFEPIPGTAMFYAVNTSFNVIRLENVYFACYQGAWFTAAAPTGAWTLAASVPPAIYAIPPTSPMYPCTYVRVYASTPTTVTFGYTAGYTMGYVNAGVVVYGTGWYYPPVVIPAPVPIYYPYPYSYAGAVYYNPTTGAWARGGAIYGPYGGVARGGTAYNPTTGAWATGGAIYGPNGGAGAFSAYNPTTGSYAHGSAVWGPDGASGNASWYNARTGVSGSTQQNSNAYGRWGSSTISGPNQTVQTQSRSNAQGSTGSFTSSSGAMGAGARGAGGNSAGAVKTAGGDVYAGADGNVYRKTDDGWSKYNNGSWTPVQPPTNTRSTTGQASTASGASGSGAQRASASNASTQGNLSGAAERPYALASAARNASQGDLSGAAERPYASASATRTARQGDLSGETERGAAWRGGGSRSEGWSQLENDRGARTMGAQRQQELGAMRERGFGGGSFGRRGFEGGGFRR